MDGVNGEISVNPNDQCRLYTFVFLIRLKERTARVNEVLKFLASNLQKVGFEVVKCDKHSSLDQLDRTAYRSRHGTDN